MAELTSVSDFWTRNLNGLRFLPSHPRTAEEFRATSELRYRYHTHLPPLFDRICDERPRARLLEIGCGMGDDTASWAARGMRVTSVDLTEPALECTRRRLATCGLAADMRWANAESLDFPDGSFDVVYSFGVLHHSPDTARAVREAHRVLAPGGLAIVMLYHRRSLNYLVHRLLRHPFDGSRADPCPVEHTYTRAQARELFRCFARCRIEVDYLYGTGYGALGRLVPAALRRLLGRHVGWHLMIDATK